jgi:hypothetical protein
VGVPRPARQTGRPVAADLRPGRACHQRSGDRTRLRPDGVGWVPRRAQQRLAVARRGDVRLRVRVLVHGLRAVRRMGRGDGSCRAGARRGHHRVRRRRLLPDAQQRPLLVGAVRAQADRRRVRQRRLCRHRPPAGGPGRRAVQQPVGRREGAGWGGACRLRRPCRVDGLRGAPRRHWARTTDRTTVIVIETDPHAWTEGGAWWEVGVPETSERPSIQQAREAMDEAKQLQRRGV